VEEFSDFAPYYDLLYADKDYGQEAAFVTSILKSRGPSCQSLLELGCGTGVHATLLSKHGYSVYGVDRSEAMLKIARARASQLSNLRFVQGDIRSLSLSMRFDAVVSLFHVMSYQVRLDDLRAALATAGRHLREGGLFLFDFWYGPAVLHVGPTLRVKRVEGPEVALTRIAEPVLRPNENLVEISYQMFVRNKASGDLAEFRERHVMRYIFQSELEQLLEEARLELLELREWLTDREAGCDSWNVYCLATRRG
jgi:SAM-dependent methyltransferase